jgi:hypothetical protein
LDVNPFEVTWREAKSYLDDNEQCPALLVQVPNRASEYYNLLKEDKLQPRMLTEIGKLMIRSLITTVLRCHEEKIFLGEALCIENLVMSSLGTVQFKEFGSTELTEKGRVADLAAVSDLIISILKLRHGPCCTRSLPSDFFILLVKLKKPQTPQYIIANHPSLLPAATYGAAFLKLYEHIMERLNKTDPKNAHLILRNKNPYHFSWITKAQNDDMLKAWMKPSYSQLDSFHHIKFGRNMICHPQEKNAHAATELGVKDYTLEATSILFQHSYPNLLPVLQEELWNYYKQKSALRVMDALHFGELFPGVPVWAVSRSWRTSGGVNAVKK